MNTTAKSNRPLTPGRYIAGAVLLCIALIALMINPAEGSADWSTGLIVTKSIAAASAVGMYLTLRGCSPMADPE